MRPSRPGAEVGWGNNRGVNYFFLQTKKEPKRAIENSCGRYFKRLFVYSLGTVPSLNVGSFVNISKGGQN